MIKFFTKWFISLSNDQILRETIQFFTQIFSEWWTSLLNDQILDETIKFFTTWLISLLND